MAAEPLNPRTLRLYFNQVWGSVRTESLSFGIAEGDVVAGTDENADLPLFGFDLPKESYRLAAWQGTSAKVYPPPNAALERKEPDGGFRTINREGLERDAEGPYVLITPGTELRLRERDKMLVVALDEQRERAGWDKQKAAFWLIFLVIATVAGPLMFLLAGPNVEIVSRAMKESRIKQGLPAEPVPMDFDAPPEDGASPHGQGVTIPASVR